MRRWIGALGSLAFLSSAGCSTTGVRPNLYLGARLASHAPYPGLEKLDEPGIRRMLRTRVRLPERPSAALIWFEEDASADGGTGFRPGPQRDDLLAEVGRALEGEPLAWVQPVPTALASGSEVSTASGLQALRSAAAHLQSDVVLLVQSDVNERPGTGSWWEDLAYALEHLASPLRRVVAYASSEACAIDVRSGIVLGCGRGTAARTRQLAFVLTLGDLQARLDRESLLEATGAAGRELRLRLQQRQNATSGPSPVPEGS